MKWKKMNKETKLRDNEDLLLFDCISKLDTLACSLSSNNTNVEDLLNHVIIMSKYLKNYMQKNGPVQILNPTTGEVLEAK